jgi:hypothetical protein
MWCDPTRASCSIVANGDNSLRGQENNQARQDILARRPLVTVVRPVREGIIRFMWMQGKHIPQKYWFIDFLKN